MKGDSTRSSCCFTVRSCWSFWIIALHGPHLSSSPAGRWRRVDSRSFDVHGLRRILPTGPARPVSLFGGETRRIFVEPLGPCRCDSRLYSCGGSSAARSQPVGRITSRSTSSGSSTHFITEASVQNNRNRPSGGSQLAQISGESGKEAASTVPISGTVRRTPPPVPT